MPSALNPQSKYFRKSKFLKDSKRVHWCPWAHPSCRRWVIVWLRTHKPLDIRYVKTQEILKFVSSVALLSHWTKHGGKPCLRGVAKHFMWFLENLSSLAALGEAFLDYLAVHNFFWQWNILTLCNETIPWPVSESAAHDVLSLVQQHKLEVTI